SSSVRRSCSRGSGTGRAAACCWRGSCTRWSMSAAGCSSSERKWRSGGSLAPGARGAAWFWWSRIGRRWGRGKGGLGRGHWVWLSEWCMRFSIIGAPRQRSDLGETAAQAWWDWVEDAVLAEELGFDAVYTGEHHFCFASGNSSPLVLLAHVAARTE